MNNTDMKPTYSLYATWNAICSSINHCLCVWQHDSKHWAQPGKIHQHLLSRIHFAYQEKVAIPPQADNVPGKGVNANSSVTRRKSTWLFCPGGTREAWSITSPISYQSGTDPHIPVLELVFAPPDVRSQPFEAGQGPELFPRPEATSPKAQTGKANLVSLGQQMNQQINQQWAIE